MVLCNCHTSLDKKGRMEGHAWCWWWQWQKGSKMKCTDISG
uniref:Uncharacterized protein n=1 Tax=Arundo donax TaxID=35708 RepID=A0A0A9BIC4_ARUDO